MTREGVAATEPCQACRATGEWSDGHRCPSCEGTGVFHRRPPFEERSAAIERVMTHQELLDAYVQAKLAVLGEFSGDFTRDWRDLIEKVEAYADTNGLHVHALAVTRELLAESLEGDDDGDK